MFAYLRRHHIGLLALFIALGGTSYAAVKLPRDSVGSAQIRAGAVKQADLAKGVRDELRKPSTAGPTGPQGAPGAVGSRGPAGALGPQGEPGPTSAGVGGTNTSVVVTGTTAILGATSVTLDQPGKVLVQVFGTFSIDCSATNDCDRTITATVGGMPVPGLVANIQSEGGVQGEQTINAAGIVASVPVGTHQVQIGHKITGPVSSHGTAGDIRIVAVAVG